MVKKQAFDLQSVAALARIELSDKERREFGDQLKEVLYYFDTLKAARSQKLEARITDKGKKIALREDKVGECLTRDEALMNAPAAERGFVKVKAIFTDEAQ